MSIDPFSWLLCVIYFSQSCVSLFFMVQHGSPSRNNLYFMGINRNPGGKLHKDTTCGFTCVCVCWFMPSMRGTNYGFSPPSLLVCTRRIRTNLGPCVLGVLLPNLQSDTRPLTLPPMVRLGSSSAKRKLRNFWWEPQLAFPVQHYVYSWMTRRIHKCGAHLMKVHSVGYVDRVKDS